MTRARAAPPDKRRLSLVAALTFSAPAASMGALAVAFAVYLPPYYAGHVGLGAASVALVFVIVRAIDVLFDPAIGMLMDRTTTPLGRYRAWLVAGAPIFMLAIWLAFTPRAGAGPVYMVVVLLAVYVGQSVINLSQTAWASVLAPQYNERSRLFGAISFVGVLGAGALLLLPVLIGAKSGGDPNLMRAMAAFMAVTAAAGIAVAVLTTPETVAVNLGQEQSGVADYLALLKRPDVLRIVGADMCLELGPMWMSAIYLYFFQAARGFSAGQASLLLFAYVMAGLIGAPIQARLATAFGKHSTLMGCAAGFSVVLVSLFFVPTGQFWLAAPIMALLGMLSIAFVILVRAMVADIGDQVRLETGRQSAGLLFAMVTLSQKIASAASIGLTYGLLPIIGFDPREGAVHPPAAIHGLELLFLAGPIGFVMLGATCFIGYRLDARRHAEIRVALEAMDAEA